MSKSKTHHWQSDGRYGEWQTPRVCLNGCGWSFHYAKRTRQTAYRRPNVGDWVYVAVYVHTDGRRVEKPKRVGVEVPCLRVSEAQ